MNSIFGNNKKQAPTPVAPAPPPPPPPPILAPPDTADERTAGDRARKASGSQDTLLTAGGAEGDTSTAPTKKKTLLGQ